jgi:hypothetical protein
MGAHQKPTVHHFLFPSHKKPSRLRAPHRAAAAGRPWVLGSALLLALAAPAAFAGNSSGIIYLGVGSQYGGSDSQQYGDGGEFSAILSNSSGAPFSALPVPSGYASQATVRITQDGTGYSAPGGDGGGASDVGDNAFLGDTGFQTFCVEDQVDFYVGNYYYYTEGLTLQQTGAGVIDQLTDGAAWLYQQFATGQLSAATYTNSVDAGEIQATLWYLQGEPADSGVPFSATNPYYEDVLSKFGTLANAQTAVTSASQYGVQVLELTSGPNGTGSDAQDQLIYCGPHVPDRGATLGLLAGALLLLGAWRRRLPA